MKRRNIEEITKEIESISERAEVYFKKFTDELVTFVEIFEKEKSIIFTKEESEMLESHAAFLIAMLEYKDKLIVL